MKEKVFRIRWRNAELKEMMVRYALKKEYPYQQILEVEELEEREVE